MAGRVANGVGTYTVKSGVGSNRMNGTMKDGKLSGLGVTAFPNTDLYEGEYQDSQFGGSGVYSGGLASNLRESSGQWDSNKTTGFAVMTWKDDQVWAGSWKDNQLNGYAAKYDGHGHVVEQGLYENGVLKTALTGN